MENHQGVSEIVAGLVLEGRIPSESVRPDLFAEPYGEMIKSISQGEKRKEVLLSKIGYVAYEAAVQASSSINGSPINWVELLERAKLKEDVALGLEKFAKKLRKGIDCTFDQLIAQMRMLENDESRLIPLSEIEEESESYLPTGWIGFDNHLIGLPKIGLCTLGASPGQGKTTFMIKIAASFIKTYPDKRIVINTLEMPSKEFKKRFSQLAKLSKSSQDRILVCEEIMSVEAVANLASSVENIGLLCVDFADLMITDDISESEMAKIYRVLAKTAKNLRIPVLLISQLSRGYIGGLPRPRHLRWTSLAEALSWMILMVYSPMTDFSEKSDETLPNIPGTNYIIAWKARGGFLQHPQDSPGAIQFKFTGAKGWSEEDKKWFRLIDA